MLGHNSAIKYKSFLLDSTSHTCTFGLIPYIHVLFACQIENCCSIKCCQSLHLHVIITSSCDHYIKMWSLHKDVIITSTCDHYIIISTCDHYIYMWSLYLHVIIITSTCDHYIYMWSLYLHVIITSICDRFTCGYILDLELYSVSNFSGVGISGLIKLYVCFRLWIYFKSKERIIPQFTVHALHYVKAF